MPFQEAEKLIVTQQLVKRDSVEAVALAFGIDISDIGFLDVATQQRDAAREPAIRIHRDRSDRIFWTGRAALALAGSAVLLTLAAGGIDYWRQQSALDALGPQLSHQQITTIMPRRSVANFDIMRMRRRLIVSK